MSIKHKYADAIKAWADGFPIEFRYIGEALPGFSKALWYEWPGDNPPFSDCTREWRVKQVYPTLAEIARDAFFKVGGIEAGWESVANTVKAAINSGEYSK